MHDRLKRLMRDESGITALETAIILIAFVVVAAVFAFTVLSAGTTSTQRGKEAIYAGLEEVSSSLEQRGSLLALATTTGVTGTVDSIVFTVSNVAGGTPIDLTTPPSNKVVIDYRDKDQSKGDLAWTKKAIGDDDGDDLLEDGEMAEITVTLTGAGGLTTPLGVDKSFSLEVKPARGGVLVLEKRTPSYIDKVIDLH